MPAILALDIATRTGWARSNDAGVAASGVLDLSRWRADYAEMGWHFGVWIADQIAEYRIRALVVERPFMRFGDVTYLLGGLAFHARAIAHGHGVLSAEIAATTIKKFATGSGRASKPDVVRAVRGWGFDPADDNEADAIALLTYAMQRQAA